MLTRLRLFAPIFYISHCLALTIGAKVGTTKRLVYAGLVSDGDPRWRLRGQLQMQPVEQQSLVGLRLGVTAQNQGASVGGRQVHIDHLDGGDFSKAVRGVSPDARGRIRAFRVTWRQ